MMTFGEIVYSVLDILKERSDDAYYTEEHIVFLSTKMRALLLERKYKGSRNGVFSPMSSENEQEICLDVAPAEMLPDGCSGLWLRSIEEMPETLNADDPTAYSINNLLHGMVTFIPSERMPYVGYNKWLRNIIYASRSNDGHLYLTSSNPQAVFLKKVRVNAIFADPAEAAKLNCKEEGGEVNCDILKEPFPLEAALVPSCIELIVQELTGSRYAPEDKDNDAKDGLGDAAVVSQKASTPVESSEPRQR